MQHHYPPVQWPRWCRVDLMLHQVVHNYFYQWKVMVVSFQPQSLSEVTLTFVSAAILPNFSHQKFFMVYRRRPQLFSKLMPFYIISKSFCGHGLTSLHPIDGWNAFTLLNLCQDNTRPSGRRAFTLAVCRESQYWSALSQTLPSRPSNSGTVQPSFGDI